MSSEKTRSNKRPQAAAPFLRVALGGSAIRWGKNEDGADPNSEVDDQGGRTSSVTLSTSSLLSVGGLDPGFNLT